MATAFGPEGCVILYLLSKIEPRVHVFNLDTGYQFQETLELRDEIARRYGIEVELKRDRHARSRSTRPSTAARSIKTNPDQCCFDRKVQVLREASRGWSAWMSGDPPRSEPRPRQGADRRLGPEVRPREDQPAGQLDQEGRLEADHRREDSLQPAARPGLHEHRLLALHARGDVRRRRARRPLERLRQNRMRPAHFRVARTNPSLWSLGTRRVSDPPRWGEERVGEGRFSRSQVARLAVASSACFVFRTLYRVFLS